MKGPYLALILESYTKLRSEITVSLIDIHSLQKWKLEDHFVVASFKKEKSILKGLDVACHPVHRTRRNGVGNDEVASSVCPPLTGAINHSKT